MTQFNKLFSTMCRPWVALIYWGVVVICYRYFDQKIAFFLHELDLETNLAWLNWVTKLGIGAIYFVGFFLLALYFQIMAHNKKRAAQAWFLWFSVVVPSMICFILKVTLGRARPTLLFEKQHYGLYGVTMQTDYWSFPSGHTTTVMGLVFGLSVLFPRYCYALVLSGLFVVSSRVLLTNHYVSDVLGASYLALIEVGLLAYWMKKKAVLQVEF